MTAILTLLGALAFVPLIIMYNAFAWGYVSSIIYAWFIIPIFPEAPVLTWIQLAGIIFLLQSIMPISPSYIKDEYRDKVQQWTNFILNPWLILFGAWLFKVFIY